MRTSKPSRSGPASAFPPRRNGNSRRVAGSRDRSIPGAMSSWWTGASWRTRTRATSPNEDTQADALSRCRPGRAVPAECLRAVRRRRQRLGVDQRLVPGRLLRRARESGGRAQSAGPGGFPRSQRAGRRQACASRRFIPVHRAVLLTLHGRHARQGRTVDRHESPRHAPRQGRLLKGDAHLFRQMSVPFSYVEIGAGRTTMGQTTAHRRSVNGFQGAHHPLPLVRQPGARRRPSTTSRFSRTRRSARSPVTARPVVSNTAETPGSVLIVEFELDGQPFTALNGGPMFKFNEAVSLQVRCKTRKRWTTTGRS